MTDLAVRLGSPRSASPKSRKKHMSSSKHKACIVAVLAVPILDYQIAKIRTSLDFNLKRGQSSPSEKH